MFRIALILGMTCGLSVVAQAQTSQADWERYAVLHRECEVEKAKALECRSADQHVDLNCMLPIMESWRGGVCEKRSALMGKMLADNYPKAVAIYQKECMELSLTKGKDDPAFRLLCGPTSASRYAAIKRQILSNYIDQARRRLQSMANEAHGKPRKKAERSQAEKKALREKAPEEDQAVVDEANSYEAQLFQAIKAKYQAPELISHRELLFLKATVVVTLGDGGEVKDLAFEKRSGNSLFDAAIEVAVRRAAPLPVPPPMLGERYATTGIKIDIRASKL